MTKFITTCTVVCILSEMVNDYLYLLANRVRKMKVMKKRREEMKMGGWCHTVTSPRTKAVRTMKRLVDLTLSVLISHRGVYISAGLLARFQVQIMLGQFHNHMPKWPLQSLSDAELRPNSD